MKFYALLILFGAQSIPIVNSRQIFRNYGEDIGNVEYAREMLKTPLQHEGENNEEPSRLSLRTLESLTNDEVRQEFYDDQVPVFVPVNIRPPMMPRALPWNNWTPYDMDNIHDPRYNYGAPYQLPPYMFMNSVPPVRSLPPVFSTQIHETLPDLEDRYEADDLNLEDAIYQYLTPNVRAVRSRDEELLDQLRHDALIPNIIPTMPVPFPRSTGAYSAHVQDVPLMAVFSQTSDCGLPILFKCSPNVASGSLAKQPYSAYSLIAPAVSGVQYRKEPDTLINPKVHDVLAPVAKIVTTT